MSVLAEDTWSSYSWYLGPYREQVCAEIRRFGQKRKETLCFLKKNKERFFFLRVMCGHGLIYYCPASVYYGLHTSLNAPKFLLRPICSPVFRIPIFFYPVFQNPLSCAAHAAKILEITLPYKLTFTSWS